MKNKPTPKREIERNPIRKQAKGKHGELLKKAFRLKEKNLKEAQRKILKAKLLKTK